MEPRQVAGIVHAPLGQHLDRALAMHELVLGQIDGAHAAAADETEHAVLAEGEAAVLLLHQLLDVPGGEQLAVDEKVGEEVGVGGHLAAVRLLEFVEGGLQRLRLDELAALDVIKKALDREGRHIAVETAVARRCSLAANCQARSASEPTSAAPTLLSSSTLARVCVTHNRLDALHASSE